MKGERGPSNEVRGGAEQGFQDQDEVTRRSKVGRVVSRPKAG